jgi:hypothetical protein
MIKYSALQYLSLFVLIIAISGCKKSATDNDQILSIEDVLVQNNEITGWSYSGTGWVANNISELTTYINGAAEIYQRHSFVEAAQQSYRGNIDNSERQLNLSVYNQTNQTEAQATYEDPDIGMSGAIEWTGGAGNEAHFIRNSGLSQVLTFYRGKYFIYIEINYDTEESLNILKQFALNVDGKIQ